MGLGSGRRAMKSPPLLIAVLLACVFVLGINYWITSTRCVELQNQVMELEGRIRRAAVERGAVEMKKNEFEDMLSKQKKQIDNIQSLHSSQLQNVNLFCKSEKEHLLSNLTFKDGLIQNLQVDIANVQKQLEDSKLEFKELQDSQAKKSTYELTQCRNKITEMNEQCEEQIRRLTGKDGNALIKEEEEEDRIETKSKRIQPVTSKQDFNQKVIDTEEQKEKVVISTPKKPTEISKKEVVPLPESKEQVKKVNDNIDEKKPSPLPHQLKKEEEEDEKEETRNEVNPNLANADDDDDELKAEDVEDPNKEIENYEVERENLINMDGQTDEKVSKPIQQEEGLKLSDYNGDEANEAESETEKQVELGANDQNLGGVKHKKELYEFALNQQAEEGEDTRLK